DVRRIHLHRAMVLEQRLGRPDEARNELEAVLAATGDNMSVLRVLADLDERLGTPLRAAPLWMRASAVSRDRDEAADLARRACEAYLAGGVVAFAQGARAPRPDRAPHRKSARARRSARRARDRVARVSGQACGVARRIRARLAVR